MTASNRIGSDSSHPSFVKYAKIASLDGSENLDPLLRDREVMVFEKVDGGNCQIRRKDYQLYPGTRSGYLKGPRIERRPWFSRLTGWAYSNESLYDLPENLIVFGEWMGNHTIEYDPEFVNKFFVIDIFDTCNGKLVPYDKVPDLMGSFGVGGLNYLEPLVNGKTTSAEIDSLVRNRKSDFYDGPMEGVVVKDYSANPQMAWKKLHPDFAERRTTRFGDSGFKGIDAFLTPSRVIKAAYRLLDETSSPELTVDAIATEVAGDILREERKNGDLNRVRGYVLSVINEGRLDKVKPYIVGN